VILVACTAGYISAGHEIGRLRAQRARIGLAPRADGAQVALAIDF
jgi:hypothetical protein